jgi:DNA repair exonuclease SbcCD ATPase subunit
MILNNLKLFNYKQYAALSLDFREGLVGMSGKNGAGKSTIFEAILYCLFGRDESNKNLVRAASRDFANNLYLCQKITKNAHRIHFREGTGHRKPKRPA